MALSSPFERWRADLPKLALVHHPNSVSSQFIKKIRSLSDQDLCGGSVKNHDFAQAARAGLLLATGGLEEAHRIVQELETSEAYYWHGIVHRREPDWSNAQYWFRQLGDHPVFNELTRVINHATSPIKETENAIFPSKAWDPFRFIDLCKDCEKGARSERMVELLALQQCEIEMLLDYCMRKAVH